MKVAYGKGSRPTHYRCVRKRQEQASPVCQSLGSRRLEEAVERLVLEALEPLGLEAMMEAAQAHAEAAEAQRRHWHQRVERAEYEVEVARRQYDAVDPENRLVARELERRFDKALQELEAVKDKAEAHIEQLPDPLSAQDEARLVEFARHLPRLWRAPTTRPQDRTRVVRCLIDHVVVTVPTDEAHIKADVGANPLGSIRSLVGAARQWAEGEHRGGRWITMDPRLSETAAASHAWIPLRPGTDGVLALALAHHVVDKGWENRSFLKSATDVDVGTLRELLAPWTPEKAGAFCDVPADRIRSIAREFATGERPVILFGSGVTARKGGLESAQAILVQLPRGQHRSQRRIPESLSSGMAAAGSVLLPAGVAGLAVMAVPAIGVLSSRLQLGEQPGAIESVGMALIVASLAVLSWSALRRRCQ